MAKGSFSCLGRVGGKLLGKYNRTLEHAKEGGGDETISSLIFDASRQGGRGGLSGPSYPSLKLDTKSTPTMLNGTIWTHLAYFSFEITLSMRGVKICACVEIQD